MKAFAIVALSVLAGCAQMSAPVPVAARLSQQVLSLTLSNGAVCRAQWREAAQGQICGFDYRVTEVSNPNVLHQLWTSFATALGAEGAVTPLAEVVIRDAQGRAYRYVSPEQVALN